jgi:hypothetical protein
MLMFEKQVHLRWIGISLVASEEIATTDVRTCWNSGWVFQLRILSSLPSVAGLDEQSGNLVMGKKI